MKQYHLEVLNLHITFTYINGSTTHYPICSFWL